jgi:hypothetical protein
MPFSLPAGYNPGDQYSNVAANNVAAAINQIVNGVVSSGMVNGANPDTFTNTAYARIGAINDKVTFTPGQSGVVIMFVNALFAVNNASYYTSLGFTLSGGNTGNYPLFQTSLTTPIGCGAHHVLSGLAAVSTTAQFVGLVASGGTGSLWTREISAIVLP